MKLTTFTAVAILLTSVINFVQSEVDFQFHCVLPVSNTWIDCCRHIDLNGDGKMDILVSCQMKPSSMFLYGELINNGHEFCLRRANADFLISGFYRGPSVRVC